MLFMCLCENCSLKNGNIGQETILNDKWNMKRNNWKSFILENIMFTWTFFITCFFVAITVFTSHSLHTAPHISFYKFKPAILLLFLLSTFLRNFGRRCVYRLFYFTNSPNKRGISECYISLCRRFQAII